MNPFKVLPIRVVKINPFKALPTEKKDKPLDPEADPFKNAFINYDDIPF